MWPCSVCLDGVLCHQHTWQVIVFILLKVFPEPHTRIGKVPAFLRLQPHSIREFIEILLFIMKKILLLCCLLFSFTSMNCFAQLTIQSGNVCAEEYYRIGYVEANARQYLTLKQHRSGSYILLCGGEITINLGKSKESALQSLKDLYELCSNPKEERYIIKDKANQNITIVNSLGSSFQPSITIYRSDDMWAADCIILSGNIKFIEELISKLSSYKPVKFV